ncbi:MAG TPA: serine/threonine-protein kinase [Bryobacteraceae bacterium]|nr:serine/threonine-protein kinase [Bryobacteraceae bacterium]
MTEQRWSRVKQVLGTALELRGDARSEFVAQACGTDADLRDEVEALLVSSDEADDFIEKPALASADFPSEDPDALLETRLGNYRILQLIGEGGMGAVYRAMRDEGDFPLQVAVKVVKRGMDSKAILRRFREERRILARLDHPNIAKLLDGGITPDGRPYFVMEFLEGTPIHVYCQKHDLSVRERIDLFLGACSAVEYSHRNLIVHRDLKATNILVSDGGMPKLLDFGIAKLLTHDSTTSQETTIAAERLMTPDYASPEQIRGEAITTSTDVYSLGVLLFEVLTGQRPFRLLGLSNAEMSRVIATTDPPKPSSVAPAHFRQQLKGDLDTIVLKALERSPDRRYASVQALAEDLQRHLMGKPVKAQPDRVSYRVRKFLGRHRTSVAAGVLITLAFFGLATAYAWQFGVAQAREREARKRFTDLRELATSFLGDLDGELNKIPGSTPAREILASKVLRYLDMLAHDDIQDRSLQRELATAYDRLGDVQGGPKSSNLGNSAAALESYGKSLTILERLSTAEPQNGQLALDLANGHSKLSDLLSLMGEHQTALEQEERALAAREAWLARNQNDREAKRAVAAGSQELAGDLERLGRYDQAVAHRRRALVLLRELTGSGEADDNLRLALALAEKRMGRIVLRKGSFRDAHHYFDRAMAIEKQVIGERHGQLVARMNLSFSHHDKGLAYLQAGSYDPALQSFTEALRIREQLSAADPKNVRAASLLAATRLHMGLTRLRKGLKAEAIADFKWSLESRERLAARDVKNAGARAEIAEALAALGDAYTAQGSKAEARRRYEAAREIYLDLRRRRSLAAEFAGEPERLAAAIAQGRT